MRKGFLSGMKPTESLFSVSGKKGRNNHAYNDELYPGYHSGYLGYG